MMSSSLVPHRPSLLCCSCLSCSEVHIATLYAGVSTSNPLVWRYVQSLVLACPGNGGEFCKCQDAPYHTYWDLEKGSTEYEMGGRKGGGGGGLTLLRAWKGRPCKQTAQSHQLCVEVPPLFLAVHFMRAAIERPMCPIIKCLDICMLFSFRNHQARPSLFNFTAPTKSCGTSALRHDCCDCSTKLPPQQP